MQICPRHLHVYPVAWSFDKKFRTVGIFWVASFLQHLYPITLYCLHNSFRFGCMMMSSNGSLFRDTGPLCGEFTGHRWIPLTKACDAELWSFIRAWTNGWVNNRDAGDLRRHQAHYDVNVTKPNEQHVIHLQCVESSTILYRDTQLDLSVDHFSARSTPSRGVSQYHSVQHAFIGNSNILISDQKLLAKQSADL